MAEGDIWTIRGALDWTVGYLERKGDANPRLSAEWLLSEATGMRRVELYVNFERPLSMEERGILRDFVARRAKGEPLQYITGEVAFRYIAVKVRPGVLIPRPETEVLVSEALALLPPVRRRRALDSCMTQEESMAYALRAKDAGAFDELEATPTDKPSELLVADICTGTGCIGCSIAYERPDVRVVATDIEPLAVSLARENAHALGLSARMSVYEGDLGSCVPPELMGTFDAVVSNPPYVPTAVLSSIPKEVSAFEPSLALDGGADGLDVFRALLAWCASALAPGAGFAFELHETTLDAAAREAREAGFRDVRVVDDLAGRPRVLTGRLAGGCE